MLQEKGVLEQVLGPLDNLAGQGARSDALRSPKIHLTQVYTRGRRTNTCGEDDMTASQKQLEAFQAGNRATAEIVLADVPRFGGEESPMVRWAKMVLSPEPSRPEIGRPA